MSVDKLLRHFEVTPSVSGVAICGSESVGYEDEYSDLDIWCFLDINEKLSPNRALDEILPAWAVFELLDEGRDDSFVEYLTYNLIIGARVVNVKILTLRALSDFVDEAPSFDVWYLDCLDTYTTMKVLFDRNQQLDSYKRVIRSRSSRLIGAHMIQDALKRYTSFYWRSVYQGVLRNEENCWAGLIFYLAELLAMIAHLRAGQAPPSKKWLLSRRSLEELGEPGVAICRLLDHLRTSTEDLDGILRTYSILASAEELVIDPSWLVIGHWWRAVFRERMLNVSAPESLRMAIAAQLGDLKP